MAGITLAQAEAKLALWLAAEETLATSQSYSINSGGASRTLTRADLSEVAERIAYWDSKVKTLNAAAVGGGARRRITYPVPE